MVETVSPAQARRIALAAQGFGRPPATSVGTRQLNALIERLGLLQIDSVNVFERSHYLPAFARLGAYDKAALDRLTLARKSRYLEYVGARGGVHPGDDLAAAAVADGAVSAEFRRTAIPGRARTSR